VGNATCDLVHIRLKISGRDPLGPLESIGKKRIMEGTLFKSMALAI
jgi:hypothetical protein